MCEVAGAGNAVDALAGSKKAPTPGSDTRTGCKRCVGTRGKIGPVARSLACSSVPLYCDWPVTAPCIGRNMVVNCCAKVFDAFREIVGREHRNVVAAGGLDAAKREFDAAKGEFDVATATADAAGGTKTASVGGDVCRRGFVFAGGRRPTSSAVGRPKALLRVAAAANCVDEGGKACGG